MPEGYNETNLSHIAPYQSVWVKTTAPTATLTVKPSARVSNSSAPLKSTSANESSYNLIRIQTNNQKMMDGTVIYFGEDFSEEAGMEDSEKQFNSSTYAAEIYTLINEDAYAINGLPLPEDDTLTIALSVRNNVEGQVTLDVNLEQFNADYDVFLEDKEIGVLINLKDSNQYVYTPALMGDDHDRFVLHLEKAQEVATAVEKVEEDNDRDGINIIGQKEYALLQISPDLLINTDATVQVLDLSGHLVSAFQTGETESRVDLPVQSGIYLLRVAVDGLVKTQKVAR